MFRVLNFSAALLSAIVAVFAPATASPIDYRVVGDGSSASSASLSVRIQTRVDAHDLQAIAQSIVTRRGPGQAAGIVNVYLPGMRLSGPPWASVRLEAANDVTIHGLRRDEVEAYQAKAANDRRAVIGTWVTSAPALPGMMTLFRGDDGKLYAEWLLRAGTATTDAVAATQTARGRRFDVIGGDGNYFLALADGSLELGNGRRVIAVGERLVVERVAAPAVASAAISRDGRSALGAGAVPAKIGVVKIGMDPSLAGGLPRPKARQRFAKVRNSEKTRFYRPLGVRRDAATTGDAIAQSLGAR